MNLKEIQEKLEQIIAMGFVRSLRHGSTGIGYIFETLLGIHENNIPIPDIGGRVELKTVRKDSQSLITLFTFNKGVWKISQREAIKKYGYTDKKGRFALKNTLFCGKQISQGLVLKLDERQNVLHLRDVETGQIIATWDIYVIVGKFMSKLSRLLLVFADRRLEEGEEYFHYNEAYILTDPGPRKFITAFKNSLIGIDLRMHLKDSGSVRNRGTAFRIREKDLVELYERRRRLI